METFESTSFAKPLWLVWKILGVAQVKMSGKHWYWVYGIVMNLIFTIGFPLHVMVFLMQAPTTADNIKNMSLGVIITACSTKFLINAWRLPEVLEVESILRRLDACIKTKQERDYCQVITRNIRVIVYIFMSVYIPIAVTGLMAVVFKKERTLISYAWFPFDWQASTRNFAAASTYQCVALTLELAMNYANDCYPAMALCLLSGHLKLLGIRVSRIGYDSDDKAENERQLLQCIRDQKTIIMMFDKLQNIISLPTFVQFVVSAFDMCLAMAALLFFVHHPLDRLYYTVYFLSTPLEIYPTCYYGTYLHQLFEQLHQEIFASNWISQSRVYKKNMIIFTERSLKVKRALAGNFFSINLEFFLSTAKVAYSLFTIVMRMK